MVDVEYSNAYREVLEILKYIPKEDYDKIPQNKIKLYETYSNKDYNFVYNPNKTLKEQSVSKRARAIIAILFRDYWATPIQRQKILAKQKYDKEKLEEEKRIKYNTDNLFKKSNKTVSEELRSTGLLAEVKEESILQKILKAFKGMFKFSK